MGKALLEISVAVDGYVAGPDITPETPLGRDGERLHDWMFAGRSSAESQRFETDHFRGIGALILGRRMADLGIRAMGRRADVPRPLLRRHPSSRSNDRQAGRHVAHIRHRRD
ncbi:MAG TPA: hypothetical protein VF086_18570 [Propionibacteriaceae bacterium]